MNTENITPYHKMEQGVLSVCGLSISDIKDLRTALDEYNMDIGDVVMSLSDRAEIKKAQSGVDCLKEGLQLTQGDRKKTHGDWVENHANIAALWKTFLKVALRIDVDLKGSHVCAMMNLLKMARMYSGGHNPDDHIDASVYIARMKDSLDAEIVELMGKAIRSQVNVKA